MLMLQFLQLLLELLDEATLGASVVGSMFGGASSLDPRVVEASVDQLYVVLTCPVPQRELLTTLLVPKVWPSRDMKCPTTLLFQPVEELDHRSSRLRILQAIVVPFLLE